MVVTLYFVPRTLERILRISATIKKKKKKKESRQPYKMQIISKRISFNNEETGA